MINWFAISRNVATLARWLTLYTAVTALFAGLMTALPLPQELDWPETIFVSFWMALIAIFLVSGILAFVRITRSKSVTVPERGRPRLQYKYEQSSEDHTYVLLTDEPPKVIATSTLHFKHGLAREHLSVESRVLNEDEQRTLGAIYASNIQEILSELSVVIRQDAVLLTELASKRTSNNFAPLNEWEQVHKHWCEHMVRWWGIARSYLADSSEIFETPEMRLQGPYDAPSSLAAEDRQKFQRSDRQFRLIQNRWEAVQATLERNVQAVARNELSETEVRGGQSLSQVSPRSVLCT